MVLLLNDMNKIDRGGEQAAMRAMQEGGKVGKNRLRKLYSRIHGHGGEFGVDVSAGSFSCVTGELLWWVQLVPPAEV